MKIQLRRAVGTALSGGVAVAVVLACSGSEPDPDGGNGDLPGSGGAGATAGSGGALGASGGTGGTFGSPFDLLIEEDDDAVCGHLATVETTRGGFGGSGYLVSEELFGVGVSWIVSVETAGSYDLGFRFASDTPKEVTLSVGHVSTQTLALPSSSEFSTAEATVSLTAGDNHISLVARSEDGLVDIDSLAVRGAGASAGNCASYAPSADVTFVAPTFGNATVHDPSVIETDGTYYVFGSHLASAKTTDFVDWDQVTNDGVNPANPLFENVLEELADAFAHSTVQGLWAADVLQLESTGKFLMYYNSCEGSSPLSAMGIASSDHIEGPYVDEGIFLYSGGSGYNASVLPNAIDPHAFYAPAGDLWMVYGSYSGGIYIMEMDEATGFPANDGYGTHLLGGNHIQIEGPYIQHSPETGYFYLFTSYGGLGAGDGYNMRVARATTPGGPYYDHNDVNQATVTSAPFDTSGVKMMGDHQWAGGGGYVSPGHNSSYHDAATGRYFLIFHARFPGQGNAHQIRVHQMYMTVDGWPVAAPLRYAPRVPATGTSQPSHEYIGLSEIPGEYQFINHGRDTSGVIKSSVAVTLGPDGSVSGELSGSWTFGGNNVFVVTVGASTFRGVLTRQWSESASAFSVTFAGVSAAGETLWGVRTGHVSG